MLMATLWILSLSVAAQPFLAGPEYSGANASRLSCMALAPLIVVLGLSLSRIRKNELKFWGVGWVLLLVMSFLAQAQTKRLAGNITDRSGSPLPGVTVVLKGTTSGTISDTDGNYVVQNVPSKA